MGKVNKILYLNLVILSTIFVCCDSRVNPKEMLSTYTKTKSQKPNIKKNKQSLDYYNYDKNKYENLIFEAHKCIKESLDEKSNMSLVIGPTKSGKSTLIGFLMGGNFKIEYQEIKLKESNSFCDIDDDYNSEDEEQDLTEKGNEVLKNQARNFKLIYKCGNIDKKYPHMGGSLNSETLEPRIFHNKTENLAFCDTAGLFDNRGGIERQFSNDFLDMMLSGGRINTIIFVIEKACIDSTGGRNFEDTIEKIGILISFLYKCGIAKESLQNRLFLIVNKCEKQGDKFDVYKKIKINK